jgi:hypothetical protein
MGYKQPTITDEQDRWIGDLTTLAISDVRLSDDETCLVALARKRWIRLGRYIAITDDEIKRLQQIDGKYFEVELHREKFITMGRGF